VKNHIYCGFYNGTSGHMNTGWVQWEDEKTRAGDWYYLEESEEFHR